MRFNILIGGKAGQGINELAGILARSFGREGFYVFNYRDYGSFITGGHNFNILCLSDKKIGSFDYRYDLVLALDKETLEIHKEGFHKNTLFIVNFPTDKENFIFLNANKDKTENMAFASAVFKLLCLQKTSLLDEVKKRFFGKSLLDRDVDLIEHFYTKDYGREIKLPHEKINKIVFNGAEGVSKGAELSGLDVYFGYPMTPATTLLNFLAKKQDKFFFTFTLEDEIACANAAIGASFAGARAMVGTSGGGFDLMTEAISLQGMTELPFVIYLAQRPGPSTGVPTYSGQQDLLVALFGGHGEFSRVVIAPGNAKECIEKTNEAFYLAEKFGVLSIILTDKNIAESDFSFNEFKIKELKIPERKDKPGMPNLVFKRTSYEHDFEWNNTEEIENIKNSFEKRLAKIEALEKETKKFEMYKTYGKGKDLVIGWGSTKGPILDALENLDIKFLQILYLSPFPREIIGLIKNAKNVFVLENNATSQLSKLIAQNTGYIVEEKNKILKFDGRPFTPQEIISELKKRGVK
ncbi:MAG: 2-oxoacid:acceptor oxidoreductase family protein [Candidatus Pacearchaeota archaeon]